MVSQMIWNYFLFLYGRHGGIDYCFNALFGFDVLSALQLISLSVWFLVVFVILS